MDEQTFEAGEWIVDYTGLIFRVTETIMMSNTKNYKKWEPQDGDLCIFWCNNDFEEYFVGQYGTTHPEDTLGVGELKWRYIKKAWDNIAPLEFIHTLKDK